jgi:hypothetical protein
MSDRAPAEAKSLWASLPSVRDVLAALTLRNIAHFFVSPLWAAFVFFACGLYANRSDQRRGQLGEGL